MRAMRVDPMASDRFPEDVMELQAFLAGDSLVPGVEAVPCAGSDVPLYILGSSLFGAQLAAKLGLPYGFASHFARAHCCRRSSCTASASNRPTPARSPM